MIVSITYIQKKKGQHCVDFYNSDNKWFLSLGFTLIAVVLRSVIGNELNDFRTCKLSLL